MPSKMVVAEALLGVTEHALDCLYEYEGKGTWLFERRGNKKNGPVVATRLLWNLPVENWRHEYPVVNTLKRMFGTMG